MTTRNWQLGCAELKQRGAFLLKSKLWSDCTFQLEHVSIKAHKLIMAMASPVFAKMLYGGAATEPVVIYDVRPEVFNILLESIYSDNLNIDCSKNACDLYYAAQKWHMPYVVKKCVKYLSKHMSPENVCNIYQVAYENNEFPLLTACEKIFRSKTYEIINDRNFYEASLDTILRLVTQEPLNIDSELDLFEAVHRHAEYQDRRAQERANRKRKEENETDLPGPTEEATPAKRSRNFSEHSSTTSQDQQDNGECADEDSQNKHSEDISPHATESDTTLPLDEDQNIDTDKTQYRNLIEGIRFLTLTPVEFAECSFLSPLLTIPEIMALSMNISSKCTRVPMPDGFSTNMVPRSLKSLEERSRQMAVYRSTIHNFEKFCKYESDLFYLQESAWVVKAIVDLRRHKNALRIIVSCFYNGELPDWARSTKVKVKFCTRNPVPKELHKIPLNFKETNENHVQNWTINLNRSEILRPEYGFVDDSDSASYKLYVTTSNASPCGTTPSSEASRTPIVAPNDKISKSQSSATKATTQSLPTSSTAPVSAASVNTNKKTATLPSGTHQISATPTLPRPTAKVTPNSSSPDNILPLPPKEMSTPNSQISNRKNKKKKKKEKKRSHVSTTPRTQVNAVSKVPPSPKEISTTASLKSIHSPSVTHTGSLQRPTTIATTVTSSHISTVPRTQVNSASQGPLYPSPKEISTTASLKSIPSPSVTQKGSLQHPTTIATTTTSSHIGTIPRTQDNAVSQIPLPPSPKEISTPASLKSIQSPPETHTGSLQRPTTVATSASLNRPSQKTKTQVNAVSPNPTSPREIITPSTLRSIQNLPTTVTHPVDVNLLQSNVTQSPIALCQLISKPNTGTPRHTTSHTSALSSQAGPILQASGSQSTPITSRPLHTLNTRAPEQLNLHTDTRGQIPLQQSRLHSQLSHALSSPDTQFQRLATTATSRPPNTRSLKDLLSNGTKMQISANSTALRLSSNLNTAVTSLTQGPTTPILSQPPSVVTSNTRPLTHSTTSPTLTCRPLSQLMPPQNNVVTSNSATTPTLSQSPTAANTTTLSNTTTIASPSLTCRPLSQLFPSPKTAVTSHGVRMSQPTLALNTRRLTSATASTPLTAPTSSRHLPSSNKVLTSPSFTPDTTPIMPRTSMSYTRPLSDLTPVVTTITSPSPIPSVSLLPATRVETPLDLKLNALNRDSLSCSTPTPEIVRQFTVRKELSPKTLHDCKLG